MAPELPTLQGTKLSVVSLVGYQGAGKSSISKYLGYLYDVAGIEVSSIVRAIVEGMSRDELPQTTERTKTDPEWLSSIVHGVLKEKTIGNVAVLTGVREPNIHTYLSAHDMDVYSVEIRCHALTRYKRVLELGKVTSARQFLNHEADEINMGIRETLHASPYCVETNEETSPKLIAAAIKERLMKEGVK